MLREAGSRNRQTDGRDGAQDGCLEESFIEINKRVGFRLLTKFGEKGMINARQGHPGAGRSYRWWRGRGMDQSHWRPGQKCFYTWPEMFLPLKTSMGRDEKIAVYQDNANPTKKDVKIRIEPKQPPKQPEHPKRPRRGRQHRRGRHPLPSPLRKEPGSHAVF